MSPTKLPTRQLGKNGPQVAAIGFGMMGLSLAYGAVGSEEERLAVLDYAHAAGETFWDTADIYGDSEDLIGKWFKKTGKRSDIFLASKFGIKYDPVARVMSACGTPEYVKESVEKSLNRLGVDYIDLYYAHRIDKTVPIEHTIAALAKFVKAGKIGYLGLSECSAQTLRRAHAVHPIACVQVEYSPFALEIEKPEIDLLSTCRELGVAILAYSPLGRGMMTGSIKSPDDFDETDSRKYYPRFSAENFPKNLDLVNKVSEIAKKKGCTPGQLTLAWILAQGDDFIPIPGTKKIKYLQENLDSLKVTVTPEEKAVIREYCEKADIAGARGFAGGSEQLEYSDSAPLET